MQSHLVFDKNIQSVNSRLCTLDWIQTASVDRAIANPDSDQAGAVIGVRSTRSQLYGVAQRGISAEKSRGKF